VEENRWAAERDEKSGTENGLKSKLVLGSLSEVTVECLIVIRVLCYFEGFLEDVWRWL